MIGDSLELLALGWMNAGVVMTPGSVLVSTASIITAMASVDDASSVKSAIAAAIGMAALLAVTDQALTIFV